MPERYSHGHHESVLRSHRWRTIDNSAAYLAPHLTSGSSVLDVGCGPGTITVEFAERVAPGRVVGLDAAAEIVTAAEQLGAGAPRLEFVVGDAYALPFDDDTFDIVHAHQVLQHLADPVRALREMHRVARPGGIVAARDVDYHGTVWSPELPGLARWMEVYQAVHRGNGGEPDAGRRLRGWALSADFTDVEVTGSLWVFASSADRSWWGGNVGGPGAPVLVREGCEGGWDGEHGRARGDLRGVARMGGGCRGDSDDAARGDPLPGVILCRGPTRGPASPATPRTSYKDLFANIPLQW